MIGSGFKIFQAMRFGYTIGYIIGHNGLVIKKGKSNICPQGFSGIILAIAVQIIIC